MYRMVLSSTEVCCWPLLIKRGRLERTDSNRDLENGRNCLENMETPDLEQRETAMMA